MIKSKKEQDLLNKFKKLPVIGMQLEKQRYDQLIAEFRERAKEMSYERTILYKAARDLGVYLN